MDLAEALRQKRYTMLHDLLMAMPDDGTTEWKWAEANNPDIVNMMTEANLPPKEDPLKDFVYFEEDVPEEPHPRISLDARLARIEDLIITPHLDEKGRATYKGAPRAKSLRDIKIAQLIANREELGSAEHAMNIDALVRKRDVDPKEADMDDMFLQNGGN